MSVMSNANEVNFFSFCMPNWMVVFIRPPHHWKRNARFIWPTLIVSMKIRTRNLIENRKKKKKKRMKKKGKFDCKKEIVCDSFPFSGQIGRHQNTVHISRITIHTYVAAAIHSKNSSIKSSSKEITTSGGWEKNLWVPKSPIPTSPIKSILKYQIVHVIANCVVFHFTKLSVSKFKECTFFLLNSAGIVCNLIV